MLFHGAVLEFEGRVSDVGRDIDVVGMGDGSTDSEEGRCEQRLEFHGVLPRLTSAVYQMPACPNILSRGDKPSESP